MIKIKSMIFKAQINPRDFDGYFDMIGKLENSCRQVHGARFDVTKIAMGQLTHNSEMCWFEGYVDDEEIYQIKKKKDFDCHVEEAIKFLQVNGYEVISKGDKDKRSINIHIASFGEFHITQNTTEHLHQLKNKIVEILTRAVNDASMIDNGR